MNDKPGLNRPAQTDADAANSATPDTDRLPAWNDQDWDSYLYAVDLDFRVEWEMAHGADPEDVQAMIDEWHESHEGED